MMFTRLTKGSSAVRPSFQPQLEEMSERIVPAALTAAIPESVAALAGHGQGTFTTQPFISIAGPQYQLSGSAHLNGLGHFALDGSMSGVGGIVQGHAHGTLTFSNAEGSITVDLEGPDQNGFAPLPELFSEQIVQGTGAYADLSGQEMVKLNLKPAAGISDGLHGAFRLIEVQPLQGHGSGTFIEEPPVPDVGQQFELQGSAHLAGLGQFSVTGSVGAIGVISVGNAQGTLTFSNSHGSITVQLEGPLQPSFSTLPHDFTYDVISATGDFDELSATGTLHLALHTSGQSGHNSFNFSIT
jgi:hypothetical protein